MMMVKPMVYVFEEKFLRVGVTLLLDILSPSLQQWPCQLAHVQKGLGRPRIAFNKLRTALTFNQVWPQVSGRVKLNYTLQQMCSLYRYYIAVL